jgi:hypothetical protein
MSRKDDLSPEHISWLVKSRSRNQDASLHLYLVMKDNAVAIAADWDLSNAAQALAAVAFSLWRAVFLSDINDDITATAADAEAFLGNLILHNMVAYPQDRNTRDWTFMYYVNNARYRLESISKGMPHVLTAALAGDGLEVAKNAKDYWAFYQNALEIAVRNFETSIKQAKKNSN